MLLVIALALITMVVMGAFQILDSMPEVSFKRTATRLYDPNQGNRMMTNFGKPKALGQSTAVSEVLYGLVNSTATNSWFAHAVLLSV